MNKYGGDYVAQYYNTWIEDQTLHIQMELFSASLKEVIEDKSCLNQNSDEIGFYTELFTSWKLFEDLTECVKYLHESNIPVIHRDLKPANILIKENAHDGRFLKLCDFGLAKYGGITTITHTRGEGTYGYMAPEVNTIFNGKYNNKADIWSLGIIASELFHFCENRYIF